ncbi:hypothetical protein ACLKA6_012521 [Drosophila palustris]
MPDIIVQLYRRFNVASTMAYSHHQSCVRKYFKCFLGRASLAARYADTAAQIHCLTDIQCHGTDDCQDIATQFDFQHQQSNVNDERQGDGGGDGDGVKEKGACYAAMLKVEQRSMDKELV